MIATATKTTRVPKPHVFQTPVVWEMPRPVEPGAFASAR
jgi:hypothetical protein